MTHIEKHIWTTYRNLKNVNVGDFKEALKSQLGTKINSNLSVDEALEHLYSSLANVIETQAPLKKKKVINKKHNFITDEIISLRRARRKAERKYRKSKSDEDLKTFKDLVSTVSQAVKAAKKD